MKNISSIVLNVLTLGSMFFNSQSCFAAWIAPQNSIDLLVGWYRNTDSTQKVSIFKVDGWPIIREITFSIRLRQEIDANEYRLRLTAGGYPVDSETPGLRDLVRVSFPMDQIELAKSLVDDLNNYETIEPSEMVTRFKEEVDRAIESIHRNLAIVARNPAIAERSRDLLHPRVDHPIYSRERAYIFSNQQNNGYILSGHFGGYAPTGSDWRHDLYPFRSEPQVRSQPQAALVDSQEPSDRIVNEMYQTHVDQLNSNRSLNQTLKETQYTDRTRQELSEDELESRCAVCITPFTEVLGSEVNTFVRQINCSGGENGKGHLFCQECIAGWYQQSSTCPQCRKELMVAGEDLTKTSQFPMIINTSVAVKLHLNLNQFYKNGARAFCKTKGKKLISYEVKPFDEENHSSGMVFYGATLTPKPIPVKVDGETPHSEYTKIICEE